jgi:hypothetical protein
MDIGRQNRVALMLHMSAIRHPSNGLHNGNFTATHATASAAPALQTKAIVHYRMEQLQSLLVACVELLLLLLKSIIGGNIFSYAQ